MWQLIIFTLLFSFSTFAQDSELFDSYLEEVKAGRVTKSNSLQYVKESEAKLFKNISNLFDDLQVNMKEIGYISPKDKVEEFIRSWDIHSKEKRLKTILKNLIQDPKLALKDNSIPKLLKENRKFSQFLRESFYIFDKDHSAPKSLEKVVKPFGKLNDAIVAGNPNLIEEYSRKVLNGYNKLDTSSILNEFDFISKKEFDEFYKSIKKDVKKVLAKKSHTVHDFHHLRKQHKKFITIYFNLEGATPPAKFKILNLYITQLGDLNDIYVDMKMRLGVDLDSHTIYIDDSIKQNMNKTLKFLEEDMLNVKLGPSCFSPFRS